MLNPDNTARVFIAIDLPEEGKVTLADTIRELEQAIPNGVRWVRSGGIHLTLKFLGDVQVSAAVDDILAALERATREFQDGRFQLALSDLGVFPNRRQPRVLWAGVQGDLDPLQKLQVLVDCSLSRVGFSLEKGTFRPHLTLGRVRDNVPARARGAIGETIFSREPLPEISWEVDAIHLIHSNLQPGGAVYTSLGSSPL